MAPAQYIPLQENRYEHGRDNIQQDQGGKIPEADAVACELRGRHNRERGAGACGEHQGKQIFVETKNHRQQKRSNQSRNH